MECLSRSQSYDEANDFNQTTKSNSVIIPICLGDGMENVDVSDTYKRNYRLYITMPLNILIIVLFFVCSTADTEFTPQCALPAAKKSILVSIYALILLISLSIIIYGAFVSKHPLRLFTNDLFGVQSLSDLTTDDPYDFSFRYNAGFACLLCLAYTSLIAMIDEIWIISVNLPLTSRALPVCITFMFLGVSKQITCQQQIMAKKQSILATYPHLKGIEAKMTQRLTEWKSRQYFTQRKKEFILLWLVIFCNNYFGIGVLDWFLWRQTWGVILVNTVIFMTDAVALAYILFTAHTIHHHYTLPSIIMKELGLSVDCKDIDELIGWWQLRKFYKHCVVQIYFASLNLIMGICLLLIITLSVVMFVRIVLDNKIDLDNLQLGVWTCYIVGLSFGMISKAASYNKNQLSHVHMIRKESMALERYHMATDTTMHERESMRYIVAQMKEDIENNSDAMRALGIKIDARLMLLLRASIGSIGVAIVSIMRYK
eukprot:502654_1